MYTITTYCAGSNYEQLVFSWHRRITDTCKDALININRLTSLPISRQYAWWDVMRLHENLEHLHSTNKPVIHIDLDLIIEKNITPIVNLDYDIIISTEIGLQNSFPRECSNILGFGVCTGFYILKPSSYEFMKTIYSHMYNRTYDSYSDQVTLMNYIVKNSYSLSYDYPIINGIKYTNTIIHIDGIKICVLDYNLIVRDPLVQLHQFGNHINIDNVGGGINFLKYYNTPMSSLPLTCRCELKHLGGSGVCVHRPILEKGILSDTVYLYDHKGALLLTE